MTVASGIPTIPLPKEANPESAESFGTLSPSPATPHLLDSEILGFEPGMAPEFFKRCSRSGEVPHLPHTNPITMLPLPEVGPGGEDSMTNMPIAVFAHVEVDGVGG